MLSFEWLVLAYFSALVVLAALRPPAVRRRSLGAAMLSWLMAVAVVAFAPLPVRLGWPPLYLITGYWIPALMIDGDGTHPTRLEAWLVRTDATPRRWLARLPRVPRTVCELAYLLCYPFVPVTSALAWMAGGPGVMDRFWSNVLLAGFASYAMLPWLISRPPRVVSAAAEAAGVAAVNVAVLRRVSHGWNTFPSGHVSVATAAAWSLWLVWPDAGVVAAVFALAIATGAVAGGYHYAGDVASAWLTALAAAVLTRETTWISQIASRW